MRVFGHNIYQCGWVNEMQLIKHFDLEESLRKSGKSIIQAFYLIRSLLSVESNQFFNAWRPQKGHTYIRPLQIACTQTAFHVRENPCTLLIENTIQNYLFPAHLFICTLFIVDNH